MAVVVAQRIQSSQAIVSHKQTINAKSSRPLGSRPGDTAVTSVSITCKTVVTYSSTSYSSTLPIHLEYACMACFFVARSL